MEASINNVGNLLEKLSDGAVTIGLKLLLAIVIYLVGSFIIKKLIKGMGKLKSLKSLPRSSRPRFRPNPSHGHNSRRSAGVP